MRCLRINGINILRRSSFMKVPRLKESELYERADLELYPADSSFLRAGGNEGAGSSRLLYQ